MAALPAGKTVVALIPAKRDSRRIPHKNVRPLQGHPLFAYSVVVAQQAGIFSRVIVSSDDPETLRLAQTYGADLDIRDELCARDAPDIGWVRAALVSLRPQPDAFMILRPTTPFRTPGLLREVWDTFLQVQPCDSMRAVRPVREHPGKMWVIHRAILPPAPDPSDTRGVIGAAAFRTHMTPLFPFGRIWDPCVPSHELWVPFHSNPTEHLPELWIQTAALEVAWTYNVLPPSLTVAGTSEWQGTISGTHIKPILLDDPAFNLDLNTEADWAEAERLIAAGTPLPEIA